MKKKTLEITGIHDSDCIEGKENVNIYSFWYVAVLRPNAKNP